MNIFDKQSADGLKGIALILMVIHHTCGFPYYYLEPYSFMQLGDFVYIADKIFKICVPIYAFVTAYAYFFHSSKKFKYVCEKIITLFIFYWITLTFMIICTIPFYNFTCEEIFNEMFVLDNKLCRFSWYVWFYTVIILILYLCSRCFFTSKIPPVYKNIICLFIFTSVVLISKIFNIGDTWGYTWFPAVVLGWYIAQTNLLEKTLNVIINSCNTCFIAFIGLTGMVASLYLWHILSLFPVFAMRMLAVPFFIVFSIITLKSSPSFFKHLIRYLGKYSLNIWFLHALFFSVITRDYWQPLVFHFKNPVLIVISILVICFPISVALSFIQTRITKYFKKFIV